MLDELRKLNPVTEKGYRKHKHFQYLNAHTGNPHLDRQITAVTMTMRISDDKKDFEDNFKKAFARETSTVSPRYSTWRQRDQSHDSLAPHSSEAATTQQHTLS